RAMTEKWAASLPYVSTLFARSGQIVGTPENCRRLLQMGEAVVVFPEGGEGISKLWPERYQLKEVGLGVIRLAAGTGGAGGAGGDAGPGGAGAGMAEPQVGGKALRLPGAPGDAAAASAADQVPPLLRRPADLLRERR